MEELNSSELGTKNYWNDVYKTELLNFHDHDDPGNEWFGRSATKRVIKWVLSSHQLSKNSKILDIGCGNGLMLLELAKHGYKNLTGADYCEDALDLAKGIFKSEGISDETIFWLPFDITAETIIKSSIDNTQKIISNTSTIPVGCIQNIFDLCLDKGTYDAISLSPNDAHQKRLDYIESLKRHLAHSALFIIVSCNWTSQELKLHFKDFVFLEEIRAPSLTFGGKQGQTVSTCIFQHCKNSVE